MSIDDELGVALQTAIRHGLRIILLSIAVGAAVFMWSYSQKRMWTTVFALVPESEAAGATGSLAMELGLNSTTSQGPDFYQEYLRSEEAFYDLARKKYARASGGDSVYLPDFLEIKAADSAVRLARTIEVLLHRSRATVSRRSGLINAAVSLPDPAISKQVADGLVDAITALNLRVRQNKGRAERQFSQARLQVAKAELAAAEDSLRDFNERNRLIGSPTLRVEEGRRTRLVEQKQALLNSVEISYETARAEEVRNTPRVSVVIPPRVAVSGDPRGTVRKTMVASIFTFGFLVVLYWFADRFGDGSILRMFGRSIRSLIAGAVQPKNA